MDAALLSLVEAGAFTLGALGFWLVMSAVIKVLAVIGTFIS